MRKSDIVKAIAAEAFLAPLVAETPVDTSCSEIADVLARGEKATIRGFGTFAATGRTARIGRNQASGKRIEIPASTSVSFTASRALRNALSRRPAWSSGTGGNVADEYGHRGGGLC